jgi:hypothetical protein
MALLERCSGEVPAMLPERSFSASDFDLTFPAGFPKPALAGLLA